MLGSLLVRKEEPSVTRVQFVNSGCNRIPYFAPGLRVPIKLILKDDDPLLYDVRNLILSAPNVFAIDYSSQEDRTSAYITRDPVDVQDFIKGVDVHQKLADRVGLDDRKHGKRLRHGTRYGMGAKEYSNIVGITLDRAQDALNSYRQTY